MTVALNIECGKDTAVGVRAGSGAGDDRPAAFLSGRGQGAGLPNGAIGNSAGFSGDTSFRSNWQAMLPVSGAGVRESDEGSGETREFLTAGESIEPKSTRSEQAESSLANVGLSPQTGIRAGRSKWQVVAADNAAPGRLQSAIAGWRTAEVPSAETTKNGDGRPVSARSAGAAATTQAGRSARKEKREGNSLQPDPAGQTAGPGGAPIEAASVPAAGQTALGTSIQAQALRAVVPNVPQANLDNLALHSRVGLPMKTTAMNRQLNLAGGEAPDATGPSIAAQPVAHARPGARTIGNATQSDSQYQSTSRNWLPESSERRASPANEQVESLRGDRSSGRGLQSSLSANGVRLGNDLTVVEGTNVPAVGSGIQRATFGPDYALTPSVVADTERFTPDDGKQILQGASKPAARRAGTGSGETSATANHPVVAQPVAASGDVPELAHISAGPHGVSGGMAVDSRAPVVGSTGARDDAPPATFAALDAGSEVGKPNWIHAGARQAEAGFEDPALGWVGVRADLNGGSVHASLVPGTAEAAQVLSTHMAGLNSYLSDQRTPVTTVTMAEAGGSGIGTGVGQQMQHGGGQDAQGSRSPEMERNWLQSSEAARTLPAQAAAERGGLDAGTHVAGSRGAHISVMA